MTAQKPHVFSSRHPEFSGGAWRVYALLRGEPVEHAYWWSRLELPDPIDPTPYSTGNHRGYVYMLRLEASGTLVLRGYRYDRQKGSPLPRFRTFREELRGDFVMDVRPFFFGPTVYVPFRDGSIVLDRSQWWYQDRWKAGAKPGALLRGCPPEFGTEIDPWSRTLPAPPTRATSPSPKRADRRDPKRPRRSR